MSAVPHYTANPTMLLRWLDMAQRAILTKNRVRKELWSDFLECVSFAGITDPARFYIPRSTFTSLQAFCLIDGKGSQSLNDDKVLSICTLLDSLRVQLSEHLSSIAATQLVRSPSPHEAVSVSQGVVAANRVSSEEE
jgi:hypothetical protein